jgi:hypothetical protein
MIELTMLPTVTALEHEGEKYRLLGKCRCLCVLCEEGEFGVQEFELPFRYECEGGTGKPDQFRATVDVISCRARLDGARIGVDAELAVGLSAYALAYQPIERIIYHGRGEKRHRTAEQNKPRAAEYRVERVKIFGVRGNYACHEEDEAGEQIYCHRKHRDTVRRLRSEVLGDDVHTHKREPGDQNSAVERDPIELEQSLVGKQVHTHHAANEESNDRRGYRAKQYFYFKKLVLE